TIDRVRAAGLVHRLDTGTSGMLVAARTSAAHRRLRAAFAAKAIVKDYLAVVHGRVTTPGTIGVPLARRERSRRRMVVAAAGTGWAAQTEYVPLAIGRELTLVGLRMRTGVTHQLRVHLAHVGHAVVGDRRYGSRVRLDDDSRRSARLTGDDTWHYLHALRIESDHDELPRELATPFPAHWRALFATE